MQLRCPDVFGIDTCCESCLDDANQGYVPFTEVAIAPNHHGRESRVEIAACCLHVEGLTRPLVAAALRKKRSSRR